MPKTIRADAITTAELQQPPERSSSNRHALRRELTKRGSSLANVDLEEGANSKVRCRHTCQVQGPPLTYADGPAAYLRRWARC